IFRTIGAPTGIIVFLLDILKGFAPVAIGKVMVELNVKFAQPAFIDPAGNHQLISTACVLFALAAIVGHNYTFWLGFKGGKGIATSAGAMLAFMPEVCAGSLILWIIVFCFSGYVALASMAAALAIPLQIAAIGLIYATPVSIPEIFFGVFASIMAIWRHRSNISRIIAGKEDRFRRKNKKIMTKDPEIS
ncbi:MAG: glycerol-3-phosphate acyltransferase, partial [Verrucomicrobiales bacterium]